MMESMEPKDIIDGLLTAAQTYYSQTSVEGVAAEAVVAFNPETMQVENGVFLYPPENFVTLPIRSNQEFQHNVETARSILYQIGRAHV